MSCLSNIGCYKSATAKVQEFKENHPKVATGLKITAFAIAVLALAGAAMAAVVVNGFTPANFALNFLGKVTPFGAGAALMGTFALAAWIGHKFISPMCCNKDENTEAPEGPTVAQSIATLQSVPQDELRSNQTFMQWLRGIEA